MEVDPDMVEMQEKLKAVQKRAMEIEASQLGQEAEKIRVMHVGDTQKIVAKYGLRSFWDT